ncbi:MAG: hypothetical protein KDJ39_03960 [Gammaproteobacteria bacterium]|nr:hypothetical protein [Gammaproteobacteria bacterium]
MYKPLFRFLCALSVLMSGAGFAGDDQFVPRPEVHRPSHGNVHLVSVLVGGGAPFDGTEFMIWRERPDAYGKMRQTLMAQSGPQSHADFELGPGRYRVQARNDVATADQVIDVPEHGALDTEIVLGGGELNLSAVMDAAGSAAESSWFRILRRDTDPYGKPTLVQVAGRGYADRARFVLPAGDYLADVRFGDASRRLDVHVASGEHRSDVVNLDAGRLELAAPLAPGGDAVGAVAFDIQRTDNAGPPLRVDGGDRGDAVATIVPRGRYRVRATLDYASVEQEIDVPAGETVTLELPLNAGEVNVYATLAGRSDALLDSLFDIAAPGDTAARVTTDGARGPDHMSRFVLPAGSHRIVAAQGETSGGVDVDIEPGTSQTVAIDLDAGRVNLRFVPDRDQPEFPYSWFSVYRVDRDAQGRERRQRIYNEGYYADTDIVLPSGDYIAYARTDRFQGEAAFHVAPGSNARVDVVASQ